MKKYRLNHARKYRVRRFVIGLVLIIILTSLISTVVMANTVHGEVRYTSVVVNPGDTLWSIAKEHYPNREIRSAIYEIKKINNLSSSNLSIGQVLEVPES